MTHRPVCVKCEVDMRPSKNGVVVVDYASFEPYEIRYADEYECPKCGNKVIVGFSECAIQHHEDGFKEHLAGAQRLGLVRETHFHP